MAYYRRHGKNGRVIYNGVTMDATEYDVKFSGVDDDATSMEDGGYDTGMIGILSAEGTVTCNWDAGKNDYDSPPNIIPTDLGGPLKLYLNVTDNTYFNFPVVRILDASPGTVGAKQGVIKFKFQFKNQGPFTLPTGSNTTQN